MTIKSHLTETEIQTPAHSIIYYFKNIYIIKLLKHIFKLNIFYLIF